MTRISERQFVADVSQCAIDSDAVQQVADSAGPPLADADLDGDGTIRGPDEARALFAALDARDRDGRRTTLALEGPGGRALDVLARAADCAPLLERTTRGNDDVAFIGLNASARTEMAAVARRARVWPLGSTSFEAPIIAGHDLSTPAGVEGFVATLDLPAGAAERVGAAILRADHAGRDDLARLAALWAPAERGRAIPSRLVLSGHASGTGVHGAGGTVSRVALGRLAAALPRAAAQVEDLAVSACWSGAERKIDEWRSVFPNLRTLFGYEGTAPSEGGAARHLVLWERATRGPVQDLPRTIASGTRRGESVATWSRTRGWQGSVPPRPLDELRSEWGVQRAVVERYFRGEAEVDDPQEGPLRVAYTTLMRLHGRTETGEAEHAALDAERARLVRLLFFREAIAPRFAEHFATVIDAGYAALGLAAPDFGRLGRAAALRAIAEFETRLAASDPTPAAAARLARPLIEGLGGLSPEWIVDSWI